MAAIQAETQWHRGENEMHRLRQVPEQDNPTSYFLTDYAAHQLTQSTLLALGTIDSEGRPWTSLWGGERGFAKAISQELIGIQATIDNCHDPVAEVLFDGKANGEIITAEGKRKMVSGLGIDLEARKRVKLYGRLAVGALLSTEEGVGEAQLAVKIEQTLGLCPKYLNKWRIYPHLPHPKLASNKLNLPQAAIELLGKADIFFISSTDRKSDMDTNNRGGTPGFVRILSNDENSLTLVYPEYSGNRLYQTLGNLMTTPQAGLVFPDFNTGNVLYVTGRTEILAGSEASSLIPHTNLAVKISVKALRFVTDGLGFRGREGEYSPYNPPVRYLATERQGIESIEKGYARLVKKDILTPNVGRFRFKLMDSKKPSQWMPGQYVALNFQKQLDIGYSHMRDDDPTSLNDDYIRTFTVSSRQDALPENEFEMTIRRIGKATGLLFNDNLRMNLEVPLQGFGGEFYIKQAAGETISFVAAGIGITPVLPQAQDLDLERFRLYWTVRAEDVDLVLDTFSRSPGLANSTELFVTGSVRTESNEWEKLEASGAMLQKRRIVKDDLVGNFAVEWYICTGPALRKSLLGWLDGKAVYYEDFNY
ncbi:hypothetical protein V500_07909 [Pseudogymnoascus sp. VKM F-4518 (FW-2643)]|nr:hypothetical protein V500_07909 [Pseudogymnoascus sp. VKM F-4518 (FW-2643)]